MWHCTRLDGCCSRSKGQAAKRSNRWRTRTHDEQAKKAFSFGAGFLPRYTHLPHALRALHG